MVPALRGFLAFLRSRRGQAVNGAILYARSSRDDGTETYSIDSQVRKAEEYAEHVGLSVVEVVYDEVTGTTLERPGWNRAVSLLRSGTAQHLVVLKVNRIARRSHLAQWVLSELMPSLGASLHIVEWGGIADPRNNNHVLLFGIQSLMGQNEHSDILERTQRGRREKAQQGQLLLQGLAPFGYAKAGTRKEQHLVIVEAEAVIIRDLFRRFVGGETVTKLAGELNALGVGGPAATKGRTWQLGRKAWSGDIVRNRLRDPRYKGEFTNFHHSQIGTPVQRLEFPELAIVAPELWEAAKERLDQGADRHRFLAKDGRVYQLASRAYCTCGAPLSSHTDVKRGISYGYYRCGRKVKRGKEAECNERYFHQEPLEQLTWDLIETFIRHPEHTLEALNRAQARERDEIADAREMLNAAERAIVDIDTKLAQAYQDLLNGLVPEHIYKPTKARLMERREAAEKVYAEYRELVDQKVLSDRAKAQVVRTAKTLGDLLDEGGDLSPEEKQEVYGILGVTIHLYRTAEGELRGRVSIRKALIADGPVLRRIRRNAADFRHDLDES